MAVRRLMKGRLPRAPQLSTAPLQLRSFSITGLFRSLNHEISFPVPTDEGTDPSLVILHGRNGVGKTTVLRMLDGLMRLDFNTFRRVPFSSSVLRFTNGKSVSVKARGDKVLQALEVSYDDLEATLAPEQSGPLQETATEQVNKFRERFFADTQGIRFEFIDTERLYQLRVAENLDPHHSFMVHGPSGPQLAFRYADEVRAFRRNPKAKDPIRTRSLASRVAEFIRDAQVSYRTFFSVTEPDLFARIIDRLASARTSKYEPNDLRKRLTAIFEQDQQTSRLGLEPDRWDFQQIMTQIEATSKTRGLARDQALAVLGSYVEVLESRAGERRLLSERLLTFERLVSDFFADKRVTVSAKDGILITTEKSELLSELQLSSGEFHLLFLMVAALVTHRRGTVIAIDEPEMSMHIAWQRRLVPALVECASKAAPLFILATHSPDIAGSFPEAMVQLRD